MNRNIAKAMGMSEPDRPTYQIGDRTVAVDSKEIAGSTAELPDMAKDDARVVEGDRQIDDIIAEGMVALRETFEEAGDMEPRSKSRAREVGATIMAVTLNAIRHKQEFAIRNKQQRMKEANWGAHTSINNTQINNIVASRNDIMRMMKAEPVVAIDAEEAEDDDEAE